MHLSRIPGRLAPELSVTEGDKKIQKFGRLGYSNDQIGPNGGGRGAGRIVALPRFAAPAAVRSVVFDEGSPILHVVPYRSSEPVTGPGIPTVISIGPDAISRGCIAPRACSYIRFRSKMQAKGGGIDLRAAQSVVAQVFSASPRLTDAEVRTGHLVAGFQIEGHGEVGGDPYGEGRQGLSQRERRRPYLKLLRLLLTAHDSVGNRREA